MRTRRGRRRAPTSTLSAVVERRLRRGVGLLVLLLVAATLWASREDPPTLPRAITPEALPGAWDTARADPAPWLLVLAALAWTTVGLRLIAGRAHGREALLAAVAVVAWTGVGTTGPALLGRLDGAMTALVAALLVVVAIRVSELVAAGWAVAITAVHLLQVQLLDGTAVTHEAAESAVPAAAAMLALLALVSELRRCTAHADRAIAARRSVEAEGMSAAEVEATSFLHDDLIPTLMGIANTGAADAETRDVAGRALTRIEERRPLGSGDLVAGLRTAAAREGLVADIVVEHRPRTLPAAVHEALLSAATEALRNVARHSGTHRCTLTVARRRGRLLVVVEDQGTGFDRAHGVGLRVAVLGRMQAVDGSAAVHSSPGAGTRVELSWRRDRLGRLLGQRPEQLRLVRAALGEPGTVALRSGAMLAAGLTVTGILAAIDYPPRPQTWAGVAVLVLTAALVAVGVRREPTTALLPLTASALLPALAVTLALAGRTPEVPWGLTAWLAAAATLPALAVAWTVSSRGALVVALPTTLAIAALTRGSAEPGAATLLALTPFAVLAPVIVVVTACRRAGAEVLATGRRHRPDRAAAIAALLGPLAVPLRPLLTAAATAPVGPAEAADAAVLARAVRDCLYLPGPQHALLRDRLTTLRRRGARVEITFTERPSSSATLASALGALAHTSTAQVTVSGTQDAVTVVAVPAAGAMDAAAEVARALPIPWEGIYEPEAIVLSGPADLGSLIRAHSSR